MALEIHNMAGHLIRRLHQISTSVFQAHVKEAGQDLTAVQYAALNAVSANPGIDQATLAGLIAYDRATIGGVVDRLEAKGLLTREIREGDRRAREVALTDRGREVLAGIVPVVRALQSQILCGLTEEEQAEFLRLAAKAAAAGNKFSRAPLAGADKGPAD
ncbi:MarR family winged helix-turn-helix transcriptional regulator [Chachezhania sediminis]|uniref:MarR family winged helix-turn-helix transcriptional regulator n=1 Tax=Chachezhania sediminis TaxID=2599291 RepID=UPI00131C5C24|nr:MarR family transcriptional regulator [Chachezhania sediminis]